MAASYGLQHPRGPAGQLVRDKDNPDPTLRQRLLSGQTVLRGLQPSGPDHWRSGWLYNPDDGKTYRIRAELLSTDTFAARIYLGIPLFGENRTLVRVPRLNSEGWCGASAPNAPQHTSIEPHQDTVGDAVVQHFQTQRPLCDRCSIDRGGDNAPADIVGVFN